MSQWARANPEAMSEIATLPLPQQNAALAGAMERFDEHPARVCPNGHFLTVPASGSGRVWCPECGESLTARAA